jgi:hypothetical protein
VNPDQLFHAFKRNGVSFLAFKDGNGNVSVIDEQGRNYGSYYNLKSFEGFLAEGKATPLSIVRIGIVSHAPLGVAWEVAITKAGCE